MANYILKELPGEMTDGKTIVYPKMQTYSLYDYDKVIQHMRVFAGGISEGIIRAVFDALVSEMQSSMPYGHNIKIDGLGVFSLSLGFDTSTPSEKELALQQEFNDDADPKLKYRHVCIKGINFKPDPELLKEMNRQATFDRVGVDVKVQKTSKYSREERLAKAKAIIDRHGYMTLTDYAIATEQSRSAASKDLKRLVADVDSGIIARGEHSHKIWIESKSDL
jgi:predicted histone-like DNA-binding protein